MEEYFLTKMSVADFVNVEDCPKQRDTVIHAKKAINNHLKQASITHSRVSVAQLPSGKMYKLDGHTRAYLWDAGLLEKPSVLFVDVYSVNGIDQVNDLYEHFDNANAAENALDRLSGAFRMNGFSPKSTLIRFGGVTSAIRLLTIALTRRRSNINIYREIIEWLPAIKKIDEFGFSQTKFVSGILACCILTFRIYGDEAIDFWAKYNEDGGEKIGKERCAVQALTELVDKKRESKTLSGTQLSMDVLSKAISCFESYKIGKTYTQGVRPTDVSQYIKKIK